MIVPVKVDAVEEMRRLSRIVFGQSYRLELMVAIASSRDGLVSLGELSHDLGVTPSNLQKPLRSLLDSSLISPTHSGDSRRVYYMRNESLAWAWALELSTMAEVMALETD